MHILCHELNMNWTRKGDNIERFVISASEAESQSISKLLPSLVSSAQSLACPSISNFPVAAVELGTSGHIFVGVNMEFPSLPFHHTIHAEQFLLTNMANNVETHLDSFAVSAAPCGHCRQFLQELRDAPDIQILITSHKNPHFSPLSHFLFHHFGPHDLFPKTVPLLLEPRHNALSLPQNDHFNVLAKEFEILS
ncbi:Cytidine deaminase 1 [Glycine soja]|uniref:cytidine deaminase n=1 Tax=Glycine soja TaxID=3848 RepID=A0A445L0M9_GLYSO|nr:Cytidine deaminase 1 [Glycine soja]